MNPQNSDAPAGRSRRGAAISVADHPHGCASGEPDTGCQPGRRCRNHRSDPEQIGAILPRVLDLIVGGGA